MVKYFREGAKGDRGDRKAPIYNRPQNRRFCWACNPMENDCIACGLCGDVLRRPRGLGGDFEFLPLKSPRNPITPIETSRVSTLHPELYKSLREGARRVIGATAKPLYPIDGKAVGLDRRSPRPPSSREGDRPQAVEGVRGERGNIEPIPNHMPDMRRVRRAYDFFCFRRIGVSRPNRPGSGKMARKAVFQHK